MSAFATARASLVRRLGVTSGVAIAVMGLGLLATAQSIAVTHPGTVRPTAQQAAPLLRLGSRGPAVRSLQSTLARLTYLPYAAVDGTFGMQTWHAVVAFQGWAHLARDGIIGARTRGALSSARRPTPRSTAKGFEIHVTEQVLLLVSGGQVVRAIHISTGAPSATPLGHFRIYRREPISWSVPFRVWMPLAQYFSRGYAMHEFSSVPAYPASHGCVRIPQAESRVVWRFGSIGMRVWTCQ